MSKAEITPDRRSVLFGLGMSAAAASFAPFVMASAASAAPAPALVMPALGSPVPAVFWNLAYTDFTGVVAAYKAPKAKTISRGHDLDPHAEMLAAR